jgi:ferredoxin
MATMITAECINCGACEPECPNTAIYQGTVEWRAPDGSMQPALSSEIFYIVPEKCTECVGFHDHEACAAVCPVDCCVPNPEIPETHDVLLARARALHPGDVIPDDAPSRFKKEGTGASSPGAGAPGAPSPAPSPAQAAGEEAPVRTASPAVAAPPAPPAVVAPSIAESPPGLAIPPPEEWDVPVHCFRCQGEYAVPFGSYRAGTVFRCPHCLGSFVPTLSMVRAVAEALEQFHGRWAATFERFHDKRRRELEQFEERQRQELARFEGEFRAIATRERAPGAPTKRRGFWSF